MCTSATNRRYEQGGILTTLIALLFLVLLCAFLYLARHPIMRFAAESWVVDGPAAHADAIVVLSDDNFYGDRATHAAQLFRRGVAPVVVASGRKLRPNAGMSELIQHDLIERGVPKERIVSFAHQAEDTKEEAEAIGHLAEQNHWKTLIIVTSNYHTRRARYIYDKVLPPGITATVASAPDADFNPEKWWEKRQSIKVFTHELVGMVEAMWELRNVNKSMATYLVPFELQHSKSNRVHNLVTPPQNALVSLYFI
jgi:uncharacterized SAM-binding protein YcdF (DUF218 family)